MREKIGLRSEIMVNFVLLMGAALLFAGLLLLRATENALIESHTRTVQAAAEAVAKGGGEIFSAADFLRRRWPSSIPLTAWVVVSPDLSVAGHSGDGEFEPVLLELRQSQAQMESVLKVDYTPALLPGSGAEEGTIRVTIPLLRGGDFVGAVQLTTPLAAIADQLGDLRRVYLLFVLVDGAVLTLFGVYLLGRVVVAPVQRLTRMTQQVAAGELDPLLTAEGPREIATLTDSFNRMMVALKTSRGETEAHIRSLTEANAALAKARDEVVRSAQLASVGELAAGMAHEIGNPLAAVVGYLELLRSDLVGRPEGELAERARQEVARIDRLVRDLLDYARPAEEETRRFEPVALLRETLSILSAQGGLERVSVIDQLATLPEVAMRQHRLQQVFVNLLMNARDAAPQGTITLRSGQAVEECWLQIADDGSGIDPDLRERLFDPFFTTKPPGKGQGLGLAVCQRIISDAGGRIEVDSTPQQGTAMTVYLPRDGTDA